jgi:hypothetical protein
MCSQIIYILEEEVGHGDPTLKRTGKLFGGFIADIKRKAPWYWADFRDALNMQCVATFCFMYFALLAPIVTFGGLLEESLHKQMVGHIVWVCVLSTCVYRRPWKICCPAPYAVCRIMSSPVNH